MQLITTDKEMVLDKKQASAVLMNSLFKFKRLHFRNKPAGNLKGSEIYTLVTIMRLIKRTGQDGIKVTDISSELEVAPPTASQTINKLEKKGYVKREHSKIDRRTVLVSATKKGRDLALGMRNEIQKKCADLTGHLGIDDTLKLSELLMKSYEYLGQISDKSSNKE